MGWLVLMGIVALAVAIVPYVARPRPPTYAVSLCATAVFAYGAAFCERQAKPLGRLAQAQFYSPPADTPGTHEIRVKSTPGLHGVAAHVVPRGSREYSFASETLPFAWDRIRECNWAVRVDSVERLRLPACEPGRPWVDDGCLLSYAPVSERGQELIFEYEVNERTRPVLESVDLAVGHDWSFGNDLAMGGAFWAAGWLGFVGLAVVSAGGFIVALLRARGRVGSPSAHLD
jgi:hypothetical protein